MHPHQSHSETQEDTHSSYPSSTQPPLQVRQDRRIYDMPEAQRPREKLMGKDASALSDSELLAVLLGTGTQTSNVVTCAQNMLDAFDGIEGLAKANYDALVAAKVSGIGPVKACILAAALELGRRFLSPTDSERRTPLNNPESVAKYFRKFMICQTFNLDQEAFWVFHLNTKCLLIGKPEQVTRGISNRTLIDAKTTFKRAISLNASSIIIVHNHPSGDVTPSQPDIATTEILIKAGAIIGIPVIDHIIVGNRNSTPYSMRKENTCDFNVGKKTNK